MSDASDNQTDEARWSEWMARAQGGDRAAYEKLMTELGSAIERYVLHRFGRAGGSDFAEECVQESLLAIHKARQTYDPRRAFRSWLFTIVRHKAIDLVRRGRVRRPADPRDADDEADLGIDPNVVDASHRLDVASLLDRLDPKYREALVLTKLEGHSLAEAAAQAGVSATAMKTRVHRAIRALQKSLGAEDFR